MPARRDGSESPEKRKQRLIQGQGFIGIQQGIRMREKGGAWIHIRILKREKKRMRMVRPTRTMWLLSLLLIAVDHEQGTRNEA